MIKTIISTVALIAITGAIAFAGHTALIDTSKTEIDAANSLAERKIVKDQMKNPEKYNLGDKVLRQEIALIAKRVAKLETKKRCDNIFTDISATSPNDWACINIEALVDNNLISKNKIFRPGDTITKSESVIMLIRAIGFDFVIDKKSQKNWQEQVVQYASEKGIIELFTDYNTDATRGWVFKLADTTIKKDEEIKKKKKEKIEKKGGLYSDEAM